MFFTPFVYLLAYFPQGPFFSHGSYLDSCPNSPCECALSNLILLDCPGDCAERAMLALVALSFGLAFQQHPEQHLSAFSRRGGRLHV